MEKDSEITARLRGYFGGYTRQNMILQDVNLEFRSQTVTAILGPNGAGKSTLLRAMMGQIAHHRGLVEIEGRNVGDITARELAKTVAAASGIGTKTDSTALAYTLLGRTPYRSLLALRDSEEDIDAAMEALRNVGMEDLASKKTSEMSDGQRQLTSIARALAQKPRILLLDEPTANLDPANQHRVLKRIAEMTRALRLTTVMTMHDTAAAWQWADEAVLLRDGKVAAHGPTKATMTEENLSTTFNVPFAPTVTLLPTDR